VKKIWIFISLTVVLVIILVIVNQKFMFNPLLFRSNEVTYNDWSDYTYPAKIEYLYSDDTNGWTIGKESSNQKEIKYIFSELKDSLEQGKLSQNEYSISAIGKEMKLIIRRFDGRILLQFDYYEDGNIADLSNGNFIKIPDDLKSKLLKRTFNYEK
jgi:hypothetical protein